MNITPIQRTGWLELKLEGRLDASWSDHFVNTIAAHIREGRHDIRVDAANLEYLSSAGLRALLRAHKDLAGVSGTFAIIRASEFVVKTLSMSGFGTLLALETEAEKAAVETAVAEKETNANVWKKAGIVFEKFELDAEESMDATIVGGWKPWNKAEEADCRKIPLGRDSIAIGIGAPGEDFATANKVLGDFAAAAGCVAWLPGTGGDAPDYLVQEGRFVPEMIAASAIRATGGFSHLLRFRPEDDADCTNCATMADETMKRMRTASTGATLPLSGLMDAVLAATHSTAAVFVTLAEIDGLVGLATAKSPAAMQDNEASQFPNVRDWLSYSGERVHGGAQALLVGFIDASKSGRELNAMTALPSREGWKVHVHATVFPFKPLPNGKIFMADVVSQLFAGAEPTGLLHLVEDNRPTLGLGESTFIRGACWCAGVHFISEAK